MAKWLLAILIVTVQEVVALNTLLLKTHQHVYTPWIIHSLFALMTAVGILAGYKVGQFVQRKYPHGKMVAFAKKWLPRYEARFGKKGKWLPLAALSFFSFPYINGFIVSWLDVSFGQAFLFLFVANMIGYAALYAVVGGVVFFIPNAGLALAAVLALSVLIIVIGKRFRK